MSQLKYNYGKCFALYSQGYPLEEVSKQCDIPIEKLKEHASRESWSGLAKSVQSFYSARNELVKANTPEESLAITKRLQANRDTNLAHATLLRDIAYKTLEHWILVCNTPNDKGQTQSIDPKSLKEMANCLATIHDLTYRALGDYEGKRDPTQPDRPSGSPHITINLPNVLVTQRGQRTVDVNTTSGSAN